MSASFRAGAAALYAHPDVASRCIDWQDRLGVDVIVVLFCCWRASRGRAIDDALLRAAIARAHLIERHLLRPLRASRRALRSAGARAALGPAPGDAVLAREIDNEWLKADALEALDAVRGDGAGDGVGALARALRRYFGLIGVAAETAEREVAQLVSIPHLRAVGG